MDWVPTPHWDFSQVLMIHQCKNELKGKRTMKEKASFSLEAYIAVGKRNSEQL